MSTPDPRAELRAGEEIERLGDLTRYALHQLDLCVQAFDHIVMDTDEDRARHARVVATFRAAHRVGLDRLSGVQQTPEPGEPTRLETIAEGVASLATVAGNEIDRFRSDNAALRENLACERDGWKDMTSALISQEAEAKREAERLRAELVTAHRQVDRSIRRVRELEGDLSPARAAITAMAAELAELQRRLDLVRDYAAFNRKYGGDETVRGDVAWMLARIASGECQQIGADR